MKKEQSLLEILEKEKEIVQKINYHRDNQEYFLERVNNADRESIERIVESEKAKEALLLKELSLVRIEIKNTVNHLSFLGDFLLGDIGRTESYIGLDKEKAAD